jgi:hypothetical protein
MNLLARLTAPTVEARSSGWPLLGPQFLYGGMHYTAPPGSDFRAMVDMIHCQDNVVSAAVMARAMVMSQVRFAWRRTIRSADNYRSLFGTEALSLLERPDPGNLTRPQLLAAMETHVSYAGSAYVARHPDRLELWNPALVDIVLEGVDDPNQIVQHRAGRKRGFVYWRGGRDKPDQSEAWTTDKVIHWCPEPHPAMWWTGASWVTSLFTEVAVDKGAKKYLEQFLSHAATPNLIIKPHEKMSPDDLERYTEIFATKYQGAGNAFKTLWLGGGADVQVVGSSLADLDLKGLQGGIETRIAVRSRVPAVILGIRESLQGSALTTGNFGAARRLWVDTWFSAAMQSLCAATETAFAPLPGTEMWFDPADVLILQEDAKDAADIMAVNATALQALDAAGYQADAAVAAVRDGNLSALIGQHDGLQSVQRNPTGDTGGTDG